MKVERIGFMGARFLGRILSAGIFLLLATACAQEEKSVPVQEAATSKSLSVIINGVLRCESLGEWSAFSREYDLVVTNGKVELSDTLELDVTETWSGTLSTETNSFIIEGSYGTGLKAGSVALSGSLNGKTVKATGVRGPRNCNYEGEFTSL